MAQNKPKNPEKHSTFIPKEKKSTKPFHATPMLDQLESGPWPSFVTGLKRLAHDNNMMAELLGQLEYSYKTRLGYWKGGTVSVFGYGGGIIPRFSEVAAMFPESKEFHTLRVQPPAGNHYTTKMLRQLYDSWKKYGSGLIAFHGQTGNIMFIGTTSEKTQHFFDEINEYGFDLGGAEIETILVDFVEEMLGFLGGGADEHDVAGLAVERDQAGTVFLPGVGQLAQHLGGVVVACRRLHAQRVEFFGFGEHGGDFGEARDDAAAVTEDRDRAALPVAKTRPVGVLELAQEVYHHVVVVRQALETGHEARPRPTLELVEHRRCVERLGGFLLFRDESRVLLGILGFVLTHVLSPIKEGHFAFSPRHLGGPDESFGSVTRRGALKLLTGLAKFGFQAHHLAAFSAVSPLLPATDGNESRLECL